jgi:hypothetical protein
MNCNRIDFYLLPYKISEQLNSLDTRDRWVRYKAPIMPMVSGNYASGFFWSGKKPLAFKKVTFYIFNIPKNQPSFQEKSTSKSYSTACWQN